MTLKYGFGLHCRAKLCRKVNASVPSHTQIPRFLFSLTSQSTSGSRGSGKQNKIYKVKLKSQNTSLLLLSYSSACLSISLFPFLFVLSVFSRSSPSVSPFFFKLPHTATQPRFGSQWSLSPPSPLLHRPSFTWVFLILSDGSGVVDSGLLLRVMMRPQHVRLRGQIMLLLNTIFRLRASILSSSTGLFHGFTAWETSTLLWGSALPTYPAFCFSIAIKLHSEQRVSIKPPEWFIFMALKPNLLSFNSFRALRFD